MVAASSVVLQFSADVVLVGLIALNAWLGWRTGLVRRALSFIGLYGAVGAATHIGNPLGGVIKSGDIYANAWSFVAIMAVVIVLVEVLGHLYDQFLKRVVAVVFDRTAGLLAGATVGFFQAAMLFLVALSVGNAATSSTSTVPVTHADVANGIRDALLSGQVVKVESGVAAIFTPVLPGDLTTHLTEGTETKTS